MIEYNLYDEMEFNLLTVRGENEADLDSIIVEVVGLMDIVEEQFVSEYHSKSFHILEDVGLNDYDESISKNLTIPSLILSLGIIAIISLSLLVLLSWKYVRKDRTNDNFISTKSCLNKFGENDIDDLIDLVKCASSGRIRSYLGMVFKDDDDFNGDSPIPFYRDRLRLCTEISEKLTKVSRWLEDHKLSIVDLSDDIEQTIQIMIQQKDIFSIQNYLQKVKDRINYKEIFHFIPLRNHAQEMITYGKNNNQASQVLEGMFILELSNLKGELRWLYEEARRFLKEREEEEIAAERLDLQRMCDWDRLTDESAVIDVCAKVSEHITYSPSLISILHGQVNALSLRAERQHTVAVSAPVVVTFPGDFDSQLQESNGPFAASAPQWGIMEGSDESDAITSGEKPEIPSSVPTTNTDAYSRGREGDDECSHGKDPKRNDQQISGLLTGTSAISQSSINRPHTINPCESSSPLQTTQSYSSVERLKRKDIMGDWSLRAGSVRQEWKRMREEAIRHARSYVDKQKELQRTCSLDSGKSSYLNLPEHYDKELVKLENCQARRRRWLRIRDCLFLSFLYGLFVFAYVILEKDHKSLKSSQGLTSEVLGILRRQVKMFCSLIASPEGCTAGTRSYESPSSVASSPSLRHIVDFTSFSFLNSTISPYVKKSLSYLISKLIISQCLLRVVFLIRWPLLIGVVFSRFGLLHSSMKVLLICSCIYYLRQPLLQLSWQSIRLWVLSATHLTISVLICANPFIKWRLHWPTFNGRTSFPRSFDFRNLVICIVYPLIFLVLLFITSCVNEGKWKFGQRKGLFIHDDVSCVKDLSQKLSILAGRVIVFLTSLKGY